MDTGDDEMLSKKEYKYKHKNTWVSSFLQNCKMTVIALSDP